MGQVVALSAEKTGVQTRSGEEAAPEGCRKGREQPCPGLGVGTRTECEWKDRGTEPVPDRWGLGLWAPGRNLGLS